MYQNALIDLNEKGLAHNTISGVHSTGRMIFQKAVEEGIINAGPTQYAKVPKKQETVEEIESVKEIVKYLEKEDLSMFLSSARVHGLDQDYIIFLILAYSGIRAGELCAIKWSDLEFEECTISITKTYYNPTNKNY